MCAIIALAIAGFLLVWWLASWQIALVAVGAVVGLVVGLEVVVVLIRDKKHKQQARQREVALHERMQSVRVTADMLVIGSCSIRRDDVVEVERVANSMNEKVAVSVLLNNGLRVILYNKFIHASAWSYFDGFDGFNGASRNAANRDAIAEAQSDHNLYSKLSDCREVVLCDVTLVIKNLARSVAETCLKGVSDETRIREALLVVETWLKTQQDSPLGKNVWDLEHYAFEKAKELERICNVYFLTTEDVGLDDKTCKRIHRDVAKACAELVKTKASLLLKLKDKDPVSAYQLYSYFDVNRTSASLNDRLSLMAGLGSERLASERSVIVCTDNPRVEGTMEQRASGVLIATASDIHAYNQQDDLPANEKLEFLPSGHPLTNCTYIQHPTRKNCYIESSSYHLTILERKFVELQSVMRGVGAVTMTVEAGEISESFSSYGKKRANSLGGKYKGIGGSVRNSSSADGTSFESVMYKLCMKGQWEPISIRRLPDNLEFYESEAQWKEIAEAALNGQSPEVNVRLEIKREAETSQKEFKEAMASANCLIANFDVSMSNEFEEKARQMSSMYWDYHIVFGKSAQQKIADMTSANKAADGTQLSEAQRAEALILRMARQFLTENGSINEDNKKEINEIASEYGVQKLRVLELIQSAKESARTSVDAELGQLGK